MNVSRHTDEQERKGEPIKAFKRKVFVVFLAPTPASLYGHPHGKELMRRSCPVRSVAVRSLAFLLSCRRNHTSYFEVQEEKK